MKRKQVLISSLAVGLVLALIGTFFATFERTDVTEYAPPTGAARSNRFFALEQTLRQMDVSVVSLSTLDAQQMPLQPGDTLLLGADLDRVDVADARRLAAWIRRGGHLVVAAGPSAAQTPLFEALDLLDQGMRERACQVLHVPDTASKNGDVELCGARFHLQKAADVTVDAAIGDARDGYLFARAPLGQGRVSALASLGVLSHELLKKQAAQRFAWRLLQPNRGRGKIYLVYALDGPPFLAVVGVKAWPALLALGLLLAAWMAMRSARLGPLMPAPTPHRRALLEHVQAAGEFRYRRDSGRSLHALACHAVLGRLRRRDPASAWFVGDALYERLARRSELDLPQITQAFLPPTHAAAFCAAITTLARLRSHP